MGKEKKACRGIAYQLGRFIECVSGIIDIETITSEKFDHLVEAAEECRKNLMKGKKLNDLVNMEEVHLLREQLEAIADEYEKG